MSTAVKTYKSCSDMPIYNFMMRASTMESKHMISNSGKIPEKKLKDFIIKNEKYLEDRFNEIQHEYIELTFDEKELEKQKAIAEMMYLEIKHNAITQIVNLYIKTNEVPVLNLLNRLGLKFDEKKPIAPQLKKAQRATIGLRNNLNIKAANFKARYKVTDDQLKDEINTDGSGVEKSLDSQALAMEANLETGYRIDPKKTSVLRWINLIEANERKINQLNK